MSGQSRQARGVPRMPTPFHGEQIAAYDTYEQAQRAVDYLSDEKFPVQKVAIVGRDLRMVERVTGRLNYPRVAAAGAFSGAYFGLFVGLILVLFGTGGFELALAAVFIGVGFGMLFGVISFAFTGGRRDFTSASQIVAQQYAVMAEAEVANQARNTLRGLPNSGVAAGGWPAQQQAPVEQQVPAGQQSPVEQQAPVGQQPDQPRGDEPRPEQQQPRQQPPGMTPPS